MNYYLLILRILHIGAGAFWVGNVLMLVVFINPALQATGETGQKFVDYLVSKKRFNTESSGAGAMAGIAGILLYWHDSQGLTSAWLHSSAGIGFGIGAGFALVAFIFGIITDRKMKAITQFREQFQVTPTDEQTSQLQVLGKQQSTYLYICAAALSLALWVMATARYFVF